MQGMTKAAGSLETSPAGIKLWLHEVLRVFFDRLVDDPDRLWLGRLLTELTEKHFKERLSGLLGPTATAGPAAAARRSTGSGSSAVPDEELLTGLRGLLFGDFMTPGADVKVYRCVFVVSARISLCGSDNLRKCVPACCHIQSQGSRRTSLSACHRLLCMHTGRLTRARCWAWSASTWQT
jgi:hypothetical protein